MKVLFIGNSFTARNDVPGMVARLAGARGKRLEHELVSAGGASLRMHWNKGAALDAIRRVRRDYVVLQEQSTLPVKNARRMHENVRLFTEAIGESGSRTALYLTWARQNAPESQRLITEAYRSIAHETGSSIVPVGVAWEELVAGGMAERLYDRDGSHPAPAGSYLAACVFVAALFGENPVGLPATAGVEPSDAALIQAAASRAATSVTGGAGEVLR